MKKILLFGLTFLNILFINAQAGYLRIENEGDFERIHNNVRSFWTHYRDILPSVAKGEINENIIIEFKKNPIAITTEAFINSAQILDEIQYTVKFLDNIQSTSRSNLSTFPQKEFQATRNGLLLIENIISKTANLQKNVENYVGKF